MRLTRRTAWGLTVAATAAALALTGCSSSGSAAAPAASASGTGGSGALTPVKLQLQWFTQAQFAGYYAALKQGYYKDEGLDVQIVEGGTDIVPQTQLANGSVDYALAWVPKALASREQGAGITDVAQIFQRSGTLQVSFKDKDITTAAALKGKKVGNWGFGNEFELFAGMTKAGLDPAKDVTLVQQQFDMNAFLAGDIDAAQAMVYNEYAQLLEAKNPATGKQYTADDFNVVDWNTEGTAMLQDAIWANTDKLKSDKAYQDTTVKFIKASIKGWAYVRDNPEAARDIVVAAGSKLGQSHQLWQTNEVNKLIWPAPDGAGMIDQKAWDQTVAIALGTKNDQGATVITKKPDADAYTNDYVTKALDELKAEGVDVTGSSFKPITVTLAEGGN
ncbi:ABC transporter substrate-binding protein [Cellulomonas sp. T2.31MG-18]|uniref:ABC transporter substrate-binding protein n=1 Tax=Cellulomonas sp. T2.31MG-18 TaxID=3157619 RepID=UPI00366F11BB